MKGILKTLVNLSSDVKEEEKLYKEEKVQNNVVAFTGAVGGSGVTTIACTVAEILAKKNKTVALVDANQIKPSCNMYFNVESTSKKDIIDRIVEPSIPLKELAIEVPGIEFLHIFNTSILKSVFDVQSINLPNMVKLFKDLKDAYDIVILDMPQDYLFELGYIAICEASLVLTVFNNSLHCIPHLDKMKALYERANMGNKLNSVILNQVTPGLSRKRKLLDKGINTVYELPFSYSIMINSSIGLKVLEHKFNTDKELEKFIINCNCIADGILGGVGK